MNEAPKEIQMAKSVSGSIPGSRSLSNPIRSGIYRGSGTAAFDFPSSIPLRIDSGLTRRYQRRSVWPFRSIRYDDIRDTLFAANRKRRWHGLVLRYPNFVGVTLLCTAFGTIAQIIAIVH